MDDEIIINNESEDENDNLVNVNEDVNVNENAPRKSGERGALR